MVNDATCQKQAPNQKCKPEMSLFFAKKSFIIYQSFKLKVPAVCLHIDHTYMNHTFDSHLNLRLVHTQTSPYFYQYGIMVEYSFMN